MHRGAFVRVNTRKVRGVAAVGNRDERCEVASVCESMARRVYVPDQPRCERTKKKPLRVWRKVDTLAGEVVCASLIRGHP